MTIIKIPFNEWSMERLASGQKTCTTRSKRYGNPGDTFYAGKSLHKIKEVLQFPLWFVRDFLWYQEGAKSPEEFVKIWCGIHPREGLKEEKIGYTHFFTNPNGHPKK